MPDRQAAVSVRLFGEIQLSLPHRVLGPAAFGGVKPKQLLELLLLDRGRTLTKDWIAEQLWGESQPVSAAATIETYVSVLRQRLGASRALIGTASGGYRLEAGQAAVDLDVFDRLLQSGATGDPAERYPHLHSAVKLAEPAVLADEPYADWAEPVRRQYADRRNQALTDLAGCCVALGRHEEAAVHAAVAISSEPALERATRLLMLSRYAAGDSSGALAAYANLRVALADELGVVPAPETAHLAAAIRDGAAPESLLRSAGSRPPAVNFALGSGARVAYQTYGVAAPDVVFVPQFMSNLAATWDEPVYAAFLHRLGSMARVTLYDKRGSGLSDPVFEWPTHDQRNDDLRAVLDAAGIDRAVLFGVCDGATTCVRFAVAHPERVAGLVLFAMPVRLLADTDFSAGWSQRFFCAFLDSFEAAWTDGAGLEYMDPSVAQDPRYRALFARFLRLGVSRGLARRRWEVEGPELDVRALLPQVEAPVLVLGRSADPWVSAAHSRYSAENLPEARLAELPGVDHEPWLGDPEPVLDVLKTFLAEVAPSPTTV